MSATTSGLPHLEKVMAHRGVLYDVDVDVDVLYDGNMIYVVEVDVGDAISVVDVDVYGVASLLWKSMLLWESSS